MVAQRLFVCLMVLLLAAPAVRPEPAQETAGDPEAAFRLGFAEELSPGERVQALERVVKEHPEGKWADDALWVLGEAARQQELDRRVVYYWQLLMAARPAVELEEFTRGRPVYQASGLPQVVFFLETAGMTYVREDGTFTRSDRVFLNVRRFNPVPMLVWEGLGRSYQTLEKLDLALKAYRKALESAPPRGPWGRKYAQSIEKVERALEAENAKNQAEGGDEAAGSESPPPETPRREAEEAEPTADRGQAPATEHQEGD